MHNLSKWIKHLDQEDSGIKEDVSELKDEIATIKEEIEELKDLIISEKTVEDHITHAIKQIKNSMKEMGVISLLYCYLFL